MEPGYRIRLYLLTALVLVGFGALMSRLHEFQIIRRGEFLKQVPGNHEVTVREPGIRGEIVDRNGVVLARNIRKYEITFNLDEIRDFYIAQQRAAGMKINPDIDIVGMVKDGPHSTIEKLKKLGLAKNFSGSSMLTHYKTHRGLVPYSYRTDLSFDEFSRIAEHSGELPGVYVGVRPVRSYPFGSLASHVLGYLKQWEKGDIPTGADKVYNHYIGDDKGIAGIEASMDELLRGPEGRKIIAKDEKGKTLRMSDYIKPGAGAEVVLTIDARKQYLLENVLRRVGRAAGVIMDVNTGEVLAMASVPDYDPNAFIPSISSKRWASYRSNPQLSPLGNRAISDFVPGSTMKVPTAIAGAIKGMSRRSLSCEGYVAYGNHKIGCWLWNTRGGSHGGLDLPHALQQSCNPYFNKLANAIGWQGMVEGCTMVGLGKPTGIELPSESAGILPGSRAWRASNPGVSMTPVLTAFSSIGQGDMMATPMQMCAMTACVANGGKYYQPRLVRKATAEDGKVLILNQPKLLVDLMQSGIKREDFELIRKGMWLAVNEAGGTAGKVRMTDVQVCAKTGTAQTIDNGRKSNNSWMISFAPYENPQYAVCILVQGGVSGGGVCGPLSYLVYRGLFAQNEGLALPLKPQIEYLGHTEKVEALVLPEDVLAAINATGAEDLGETGSEVGDVVVEATPQTVHETVTPMPTFTSEADAEGTVVPKAVPVTDP